MKLREKVAGGIVSIGLMCIAAAFPYQNFMLKKEFDISRYENVGEGKLEFEDMDGDGDSDYVYLNSNNRFVIGVNDGFFVHEEVELPIKCLNGRHWNLSKPERGLPEISTWSLREQKDYVNAGNFNYYAKKR